ncbi:lipopolysaccharide transport system permease protein [Methylomarinovum caldicuralii]|uniref:Transport permease protein n=1 Tax=Methylomarinovum caldicuralii TaxID=438856 RepID=A0AAU9CH69_9GAMM|nr:ABC transporter permease [Methylomarinovum caldicuralii]BCX80926.1 lipopolysaccharide transport system permease protein [Methylomarinovum caldicuralii]
MKQMLLALWRFRHFVLASIKSDLKGRYARSRLGALWFILNPLAQAAIFALILSEVLGARLPGVESKSAYAVYLMAGTAAWGLFSEIVTRSTNIFIEYANVMKKITFPRICLPVIVGGSALLNHVLLLLAIFVVFVFFGHLPGKAVLVLPLGIVLITLFAFGLGVLLGIFNVFNRDVSQVLNVALQIWFWLTPIVYPAEVVPKHMQWALQVNPMAPLVRLYQQAMLYGQWPEWSTLFVPALFALGFGLLTLVVFIRANADLVDAL